jgi:proteasome lid subunit RPN8/RPN11
MNKLILTPEVHAEIMFHVHKTNIEVSGLGRIQRDTNGDMVVTKVYLLEQENSAVTTDIDPDAVAKLMYDSREDAGDLNFWWHSHHTMAAYMSGTDVDTIKEFGKNGYLVATVFNKRGEMFTAYYQGNNGFVPEIYMDKIPTEVTYYPTQEQRDRWEAEHKEKCTTRQWPVSKYSGVAGKKQHGNKGKKRKGKGKAKTTKTTVLTDNDWMSEYESYAEWSDAWGNTGKDITTGTTKAGSRGTYTGFTKRILSKMFKEMSPYQPFDGMPLDSQMLVYDVYEAYNGWAPSDDDEVKDFWNDITSQAMISDIADEVYEDALVEEQMEMTT